MLCSGALLCLPLTSQAWVSLNNKIPAIQSGVSTYAVSAAEPVHIAVSLALHNPEQLRSFINSVNTPGNPAYGHYLAKGQFDGLYGPTADEATKVSNYLAASGFTNIQITSGRMLITATGTAAQAQKAFNTSMVGFASAGKAYHVNTSPVQVPDALGSIVTSVAGVSNVPHVQLHSHAGPSDKALHITTPSAVSAPTPAAGAAASHPGYTGPQFQMAYDAGTVPTGHLTSVAIITEGDDLSVVINDLRIAEHLDNLPVVPVRIVQVEAIPNPQDNSGDGEWDLDSQSSTGIAQNVKELVFYNTASLGDSDLLPAVQQFADDDTSEIGNMSFGGCEDLETDAGAMPSVLEAPFMKAVSQGQTWFASSGDSGSSCGALGVVPNGVPVGVESVEYPAASPSVVGVGGTTLTTDANYQYVSEAAWIAGGGGTSKYFAGPQWQIDSGAVATANATTQLAGTGRGVPDISMSGDSASGLLTVVAGAREAIGGTSLSSPLSAGTYSRLQTSHCNGLGFGGKQFYALDTTKGLMSTATGFHDVTSGTNGVYMAGTGWDNTTGFGTFDITAVDQALPKIACATTDQNPVAKLAASTQSGPGPLSVVFDETGSNDPDGDGVPWYIIDFGDGSVSTIQSGAVFPTHSYTIPGNYIATATVRDGKGNVSLPVTLPITVTGTPPGCIAPGELVVTSPPGVNPGTQGMDIGNGTDDLTAGYVGEPGTLTDQLVVTLKVNNLSMLLPSTLWIMAFNVSGDSTNYYMAMVTDASGTPSYEYGTVGAFSAVVEGFLTYDKVGALDAASGYNADGTITLILDKSALGITTGKTLTGLQAKVRVGTPATPGGVLPAGAGESQDITDTSMQYVVVGNNVCAGTSATGTTTGGTTGSSTGTTTTGSTSGGTTGTTTTPVTAGSATPSADNSRLGGGGAFGLLLIPLTMLAGLRRRSRSLRK
jgi:PKD repeat protein